MTLEEMTSRCAPWAQALPLEKQMARLSFLELARSLFVAPLMLSIRAKPFPSCVRYHTAEEVAG